MDLRLLLEVLPATRLDVLSLPPELLLKSLPLWSLDLLLSPA
jgi:hypothetical protein